MTTTAIRDLSPGKTTGSVLSQHTSKRWGNAHVFIDKDQQSRKYVVKDFSVCPAFIRYTSSWFLLWRENRALNRLQHINGIPGPPIIRSRWTLRYPYIPGITLREAIHKQHKINPTFFKDLENLVIKMHKNGVIHLDLRNRRNILVTEDNKPALIDFQTAIFTDHLPGFIKHFLFDIDLTGIYKHWHKGSPETMTRKQKEAVNRMAALRPLWILKGYPIRELVRRVRSKSPQRKRNRRKIEIKDDNKPQTNSPS